MKKHYNIFLLLVLLAIVSACKEEKQATSNNVRANKDTYSVIIQTSLGNMHHFDIELALTQEQQAHGLMNRTQLDDDKGMLFYFGEEREQAFWMKNTLIPLDMIFIKHNGRIHHIHENAIPKDLTPVKSMGSVAGVLEINGGLSRQLGIEPGDTIKHPFFSQNNTQ
ncbi:MAG: DUF192 domain-containing protein [Alphaproteobacteria bacterium]|nr:DUF192 domain-containing protein [Alphaproteobacteria bacterium]NCQ87941.1 DUF192 domain-containing protein [Alphaproteobacteria bacterium]NCT05552.1 DUF192 domain-containing protein [Alphaproteobacteria bacterium]